MSNQASTNDINDVFKKITDQVLALFSSELNDIDISYKDSSNRDYVTNIDLELESIIIGTITKKFPNHNILSEETHPDITESKLKGHLWIIDPLDGTTNFAHGIYDCSVSIAYTYNLITYNALVIDFQKNHIYEAALGRGATCNKKNIKVSSRTQLGSAIVGMDLRTDPKVMKTDLIKMMSIPDKDFPLLRIGGSGVLQLCEVASSKLDGYYHTKLKPWDKAAALLILNEAGGYAFDNKGQPAHWNSAGVIAGNQSISQLLKKYLL